MQEIIIGLVSGGSLAAIITSIFSLIQARKSKQDEIIDRLEKVKQEQEKTEKDALRTQLLVLLADYRDETSEILTAGERYFSPKDQGGLDADWYLTPIFFRWLQEKEIGEPAWFKKDK